MRSRLLSLFVVALIARAPSQGTEIERLAQAADSMGVVENLAHDFPQRVGYRRLGGDSLIGWIEGTRDGRARRIDFPYARVACAGH